MEDNTDIKSILTPRREFKASDKLRERINHTLDEHTVNRKWVRTAWGASASLMAAALLWLILIPTGLSAKEVLAQALKSLKEVQTVEMIAEVRTTPMENFKYISLNADFVAHRIGIVRTDSALVWRIDKGKRVAIGNRDDIFTWIADLKLGRHFTHTDPEEVIGYLSTLLSPEKILERELDNCRNGNGSVYTVHRNNGDIILTVKAKPQGEFANPYMLNNSIAESHNVRRYVIDEHSKHLESASVSFVNGSRETEVLRIRCASYNMPIADLTQRPSDIRYVEFMPHGISGLSASESAMVFLNALEDWNTDILQAAIDSNTLESMYRRDFQGARTHSIGAPFISGQDSNTFVPYSLKMPDGSLKRHNLVLRQTSEGTWIVVGGL